MAKSRVASAQLKQYITFPNLIPGLECTLTPEEVISCVHHIEAAAGYDIASMLEEDASISIDNICAKLPVVANIRSSLSGVESCVTDIATNENKRAYVRQLFATFTDHLKADLALAKKNISIIDLSKDLNEIIKYCRDNLDIILTIELLNCIRDAEYISVSLTKFPETIRLAIQTIHHFLHVSDLIKEEFTTYADDQPDLINRIERRTRELQNAARPKLSERERVNQDRDDFVKVSQKLSKNPDADNLAVSVSPPLPPAKEASKQEVAKRIEALKLLEVNKSEPAGMNSSSDSESDDRRRESIFKLNDPFNAMATEGLAPDKPIEEIQNQLIEFTRSGDIHKVTDFIAENMTRINIDDKGSQALNAICLAAQKNDAAMVRCLIKHGASLIITCDGKTPAHYAAQNINRENKDRRNSAFAILKLIKSIAPDTLLEIKNPVQRFTTIVRTQNLAEIKEFMLVAEDILNIDGRDNENWTALCYAVSLGNEMLTEFLLQNKARVAATAVHGNTPSHCAAILASAYKKPHISKIGYALLSLLKRYNADFNQRNHANQSVIELCNAQNILTDLVKTKNVESVRNFLTMSAGIVDINGVDDSNTTALYSVGDLDEVDMIKCLREHGAKLDVTYDRGHFPIHFAARLADSNNERKRKAGYQLSNLKKSDRDDLSTLNYQDLSGLIISTVQEQLIAAVETGDIDVVKEFLRKSKNIANINDPNSNQITALGRAIQLVDIKMVEFLISMGANENIAMAGGNLPAHYAAELAAQAISHVRVAGYDILRLLRNNGADLNKKNDENKSALSICQVQDQLLEEVKTKNPYRVTQFLKIAADIYDINGLSSDDWTPLTFAARSGDLAMVKLLIANNASVKTAIAGNTVAHYAARLAASADPIDQDNAYAVLRYLKSLGVNLHACNYQSQTPYDLGNLQEYLLQAPASSDDQNKPKPLTQHGLFSAKEKDEDSYTLLLFMVKNGFRNTFYKQINNLDCDHVYPNTTYKYLLHYIIQETPLLKEHVQMLADLLDRKIDLSVLDSYGKSALDNIFNKQDIQDEVRQLVANMLIEAEHSRVAALNNRHYKTALDGRLI